MSIALACDHGGFELKEEVRRFLEERKYTYKDFGTYSADSVDYPDLALPVAEAIRNGVFARGILLCGTGIGISIAANKVPGIRAAMCYDYSTAVNSREHNDANVLTLGAGLIGVNLAKQILKTWLATDFGGGRHAKRVEKIIGIEKIYSKEGKS